MHADLRDRILEQHGEIRAVAGAVALLAVRVAGGETLAVGSLRQRGLELHEQLCRHLEFEDRLLVPALRGKGSDGLQRAAALTLDHAEQRELLSYVLDRLRDLTRPSMVLGRELRNFAELLSEEMEYEESVVLPYLELPAR